MDRAIMTVRHFALVAGDIGVFFLGLAITVALRSAAGGTVTLAEHLPPFAAVFVLWTLVFAASGLYDLGLGRNRLRLVRELFGAFAVAGAIAVVFFYLMPGIAISPKTTLFLDLAVTSLLLLAWRLLSDRFLSGARFRSRILFLGLSEEARELIALLRERPQIGLDTVGAIVLDGADAPGVPVRRTLDGFKDHLIRERIDTVVLSASPRAHPELARHLYESVFLKVRIIDIVSFYEQITRRVPVSAITHVWFLENLQEAEKRVYETVKRAVDIALAAVIGAVTVLIMPAVAVAIRFQDRGPIFFHQERLGRDGKTFHMHKFRTMVADAEKDGARFAEKEDARVTPVGRVLRATRVDEFPQVWNVLTGEMSLIGPRPERQGFAETITRDMPYYPMRLLARPGLTGWAQVNHGYYATPEEHRLKLQYDLYYVKNRSFLLDLIIVLKTLNTMLRARGQ